MKRLLPLMMILLLFSCQKKQHEIKWDNKTFSSILKAADDKIVMIDFVKDG